MPLHCSYQSVVVSIIILLWTSVNLVQSRSAIRDCSTSNSCVNGVCLKSNDTIRCICRSGWSGDLCDYPDTTMRNNKVPASNDGTADSRNDPCSFLPADYCKNNGICDVESDKFICHCRSPYAGENCEELSVCHGYCLNNGVCTENAGAPACKCAKEWIGTRCQKLQTTTTTAATITESTTSIVCNYLGNYCNTGTCTVVNNQVRCECPPTHSGSRCELPAGQTTPLTPPTVTPPTVTPPTVTQPTGIITLPTIISTSPTVVTPATARPGDTCAQSPCRNNRPCYNSGATYVCYCGSQYKGINCESPAT